MDYHSSPRRCRELVATSAGRRWPTGSSSSRSTEIEQRQRLRATPSDCHRPLTCSNDRQRPPRREFASRGFAGERGAATDAATSPPANARWNRPQTVDLRQRPSATIVRRVHTEEVTGSIPVSPTRSEAYCNLGAKPLAVRHIAETPEPSLWVWAVRRK